MQHFFSVIHYIFKVFVMVSKPIWWTACFVHLKRFNRYKLYLRGWSNIDLSSLPDVATILQYNLVEHDIFAVVTTKLIELLLQTPYSPNLGRRATSFCFQTGKTHSPDRNFSLLRRLKPARSVTCSPPRKLKYHWVNWIYR